MCVCETALIRQHIITTSEFKLGALYLTLHLARYPPKVSPPCRGDPESNAGGSLTTSRATQAGKVKG
jgi:hypothetical protein